MTYKCCICGREFEGMGNNPDPIRKNSKETFSPSKDRCCHECNSKFVIPVRIALAQGNTEEAERIQEQAQRHIRKGNKRK